LKNKIYDNFINKKFILYIMFSSKRTKKCPSCGHTNGRVRRTCINCNKVFAKPEDAKTPFMSPLLERRLRVLREIQDNIYYTNISLNFVSEERLSYANKHRLLWILVNHAKVECSLCTNYLNLLISTGKSIEDGDSYDEQLAIVNADLIEITDHLGQFEDTDASELLDLYRVSIDRRYRTVEVIEEDQWEDHDLFQQTLENYDMKQSASKTEKELVQRIPEEKIPQDKTEKCAVCLEPLLFKDEKATTHLHVSMLPCGHLFHETCIGRWLEISNKCPLGRCPLIKINRILDIK
jgi:hypothetical protein